MSPFKTAVNTAMLRLADDPRTIFVGQSVVYDGAAIHESLHGIPMEKRLEMPVIEDFQVGFCLGLALMDRLPICIFPRFDFLLLAANQIVNHLDKAPLFGWNPKMIIRTTVGQKMPLDAGPQHTQNYTLAFKAMLYSVTVLEVRSPKEVTEGYEFALHSPYPSLIVENPVEIKSVSRSGHEIGWTDDRNGSDVAWSGFS